MQTQVEGKQRTEGVMQQPGEKGQLGWGCSFQIQLEVEPRGLADRPDVEGKAKSWALFRVWPELKGLGGTLYLHGNNWKTRLGWNQAGVLAPTYSLWNAHQSSQQRGWVGWWGLRGRAVAEEISGWVMVLFRCGLLWRQWAGWSHLISSQHEPDLGRVKCPVLESKPT